MSTTGGNIILQPGEGLTIVTLGSKMVFKAVTEDIGAHYSLIEYEAGPNSAVRLPIFTWKWKKGFTSSMGSSIYRWSARRYGRQPGLSF